MGLAGDGGQGGTSCDHGRTLEPPTVNPSALQGLEATVSAPPDAGDVGGASNLEAFTPAGAEPSVESFSSATAAPTVRLFGNVRAETSVDTRFDSPRGASLAEDVADGRLRGTLGLDAKFGERLRVVLEGRALVWGATQRDFLRARGTFEAWLGDAYVDVYGKRADVRVGHQRIPLGANAALAPADVLNPRDLREGVLSAEPEDAVLPVFAVRAQGELGQVSWLLAYAPFFTPDRYALFGRDEALLQPALAPAFDDHRIDPSVQDVAPERWLETKRPPPFAGDVALRLASRGKVKVGASWAWVNEKVPRVVVDRELSLLGRSQANGQDPDPAAVTSLYNRLRAGETLLTGSYGRQHLFSLEGSALVGPGQLDVDVTYTPRQTFVDPDLNPLDKAALTWVVGFSQASDSPVVYGVQWLGMAVPDVAAREQLVLLEPATAVGAPRTAFLHLLVGHVARAVWEERLELSLRAAFEPIQLSWALAPRVTWQQVEGVKLWLAAEIYAGPRWSPLGYFSRNGKVLLGARWEL